MYHMAQIHMKKEPHKIVLFLETLKLPHVTSSIYSTFKSHQKQKKIYIYLFFYKFRFQSLHR